LFSQQLLVYPAKARPQRPGKQLGFWLGCVFGPVLGFDSAADREDGLTGRKLTATYGNAGAVWMFRLYRR
jgi:hypothetical protein